MDWYDTAVYETCKHRLCVGASLGQAHQHELERSFKPESDLMGMGYPLDTLHHTAQRSFCSQIKHP
jgi:hypothetical protein